jgi:hypothetical protein
VLVEAQVSRIRIHVERVFPQTKEFLIHELVETNPL